MSNTGAASQNAGTLVLNREAILEAIERIAVGAQDTAERLRSLVENFQVDRIWKLLEDIDG